MTRCSSLLHVLAAAPSRQGLLSFWWRVLSKYSFNIISCCFFDSIRIQTVFISFHISLTLSDLMEPWQMARFDLCQARNVTIVALAFKTIGGLITTFHGSDKSWNVVASSYIIIINYIYIYYNHLLIYTCTCISVTWREWNWHIITSKSGQNSRNISYCILFPKAQQKGSFKGRLPCMMILIWCGIVDVDYQPSQ